MPIPNHLDHNDDAMECIHVCDELDLNVAVDRGRRIAASLGFIETRQMAVAVCISELCTNILKYAKRGRITLREVQRQNGSRVESGVEVVAQDNGLGIADIPLAMHDNFSTSGTLGLGLSGIRRMSDEFAITSSSNAGTRVELRLWKTPASESKSTPVTSESHSPRNAHLSVGWSQRPISGEARCGDRAIDRHSENFVWIMVVDGLGHGPLASEAAKTATSTLEGADPTLKPSAMLWLIHEHLQGTRGAAVSLMRVDTLRQRALCAGIGNVQMAHVIINEVQCIHIPCVDGIVGQLWRTPRETELILSPRDLLLLTSDGMPASLGISDLPLWRHANCGELARTAVINHGKSHDDACCLIARWNS